MCGRFAFDADLGQVTNRFDAGTSLSSVSRHYNVAPGMQMPIILRQSPNTAVLARWGLIPFWAKDPKIGYKMINARAEGIAEKPAFRRPFRGQRCLVPTTGFYEWRHVDGDKVPYYIHLKTESLFAFAGLYDEWKDVEGRGLLTFTIIMTAPNALMQPIHDRMPVIFGKDEEGMWLDADFQDINILQKLLDPYPASEMEAYPVSKAVNNPENDTKSTLHRVDERDLNTF